MLHQRSLRGMLLVISCTTQRSTSSCAISSSSRGSADWRGKTRLCNVTDRMPEPSLAINTVIPISKAHVSRSPRIKSMKLAVGPGRSSSLHDKRFACNRNCHLMERGRFARRKCHTLTHVSSCSSTCHWNLSVADAMMNATRDCR